MTYQIIRYVATYCPIYGGMNGSKAVRLPMSYRSEALARKLAGHLQAADYDACGDDSYGVVEYDTSAYPQQRSVSTCFARPLESFDSIPF